MFTPLQQPQPTIVPSENESPTETHEEQIALHERKIRARPFHPKRQPQKISFKSPESNQLKNVHGFKLDTEISLHQVERRNPHRLDQLRRSGSPRPRNAKARL